MRALFVCSLLYRRNGRHFYAAKDGRVDHKLSMEPQMILGVYGGAPHLTLP